MSAEVSIEVSPWLKSMPVAPEYHPTLAEFQDPIAYIFKIEKEASQYGICKIVPPLPAASRKTILANLNKSLLTRSPDPTFTTRQQQIGFCPRKHRPVQKPVWQSGEKYTLLEFEAKAKNFEKTYLKKYAKKALNPLETETLYWNAIVDKPFSVEYANDMPGSAFAPKKSGGRKNEGALTVGDTDWNMRHASRANTSLLKFMKEEIPGVTSPMVYVAMMFSWFAWHVEDHDLHSLNYLHMGAGKTWYGVPRDAAVAFEEVIREHGYSGEINPLVTFATLGEKTTVMSPEVLLSAGVPCCRLVQNAGDFVVTFPRAYHSGFSHGFNCGEAANIATPEWLRVAKEAAIRRASINCPPMVSHFQLLYDLALSLCSRVPKDIVTEPRSSRLKDKRKCEGEMLIKELFSQDMKQNNELLHVLGKGSSVVLLPQNSLSSASCSISQDGLQSQARNRLFPSLCSPNLGFVTTKYNTQDEFILERKQGMRKVNDFLTGKNSLSEIASLALQTEQVESDIKKASHSEQGLFSCVTCGILCFACVAIIQPTEAAASYLMSADCSSFDDWRVSINKLNNISDTNARMKNDSSVLRKNQQGFVDVPIPSANQIPTLDEERTGMVSNSKKCEEPSSLGLLALAYGISSESEDEEGEAEFSIKGCGTGESTCPVKEMASSNTDGAVSENHCGREVSDSHAKFGLARATSSDGVSLSRGCSNDLKTINCTVVESNSLTPNRFRHQIESRNNTLPCKPVSCKTDSAINANLTPFETTTVSFSSRPDATISASFSPFETSTMSFSSRPDEDSSRSHVFCLQHAMQVEKWLTSVGGAHVFLVCHPDYPKLESEARKVAQELQSDFDWREVSFREATVEDEDMVSAALDSENAIHGNGDWAVKLGINLFYSANLSRSPLYCKQMPYNFIIYSAFGRSSPSDRHATNIESEGKRIGRQRKIVAGKWCGKVWTSTQAHPLLVNKDAEELEPEVDVASCGKLDLLHKRTSKRDQASEIDSTMCKSRRTRNGRVQIGSVLKAKSLEMQAEVESCRDFDCHKQTKRKRATTQLKKEILESDRVDESCEEFELSNTCNQIKGKRGTKRIKKETLETEDSESSLGELLLSSSWKPIKSKRGARQTKKEMAEPQKNPQKSKNKHFDALTEDVMEGGPSTRLRKRTKKTYKDPGPSTSKVKPILKQPQKETITKKALTLKTSTISSKAKSRDEEGEYLCDMEGCAMSFGSKQELSMHKRNICPVKGCGKKFFSHKYLLQHRRVHMDDRPLKCPWKGCKMTFKWAWARTEHLRVHTGARPYVCTVSGCGQTFRFVSDFSRHKRKTGHCPKKPKG